MGRKPFLYHPNPAGWNHPPTTGIACGFLSATKTVVISAHPPAFDVDLETNIVAAERYAILSFMRQPLRLEC